MNINQQSKFKMYLTVRIFLQSSPAITAKLPNYNEFFANFDAAILQIQTHSEKLQFNTKGIVDNKSQLRDSLVIITLDSSAKIQPFAKYTRDAVLLAETKFTKTDLKDLSALELVDVAKGLYSRIETNLSKLTTYGLTAESQIVFKTAIDDYAESIPQPRQSQLMKKEITLLENKSFASADEALADIDLLVEMVKLSEPNFYTGYRNARKIVEQGTGSLQVQGTISEAETQKPIPGAILTFSLSGQTEVALEKETAAKGGFNIKSLPEGIYDVTITKVGFKPKTITITVRWDELCNVEEELEKL